MTFMQFSLRGNTVSGQRFARAWPPAATAFYLHHGFLFPEATAEDRITDEEPVTVLGEQLALL